MNRHSIKSQPATPLPPDDPQRNCKLARPDPSLPHIALDQRHPSIRALHGDVEHGAADADGGGRRRNLVGLLVERAGGEPEDALGEIDRHFLPVRLADIDELVELHAGSGADTEIGRIEEPAWRSNRPRSEQFCCGRPSLRWRAAPRRRRGRG